MSIQHSFYKLTQKILLNARSGNLAAHTARWHKAAETRLLSALDVTRRHFAGMHLGMYTPLFVLFFSLSMIFGWPVYEALLENSFYQQTDAPPAIIALLSVALSGVAVLLSHYGALAYNPRIQEYHLQLKLANGENEHLCRAEQEQAKSRYRLLFAALLTVTFGIVLLVAITRDDAMNDKLKNEGGFFLLLGLPMFFYLLEILTGEYFFIALKILRMRLAIAYHRYQFYIWKKHCGTMDQETLATWMELQKNNERPQLSAELRNSLFRAKNRSVANEDYTDDVASSQEPLFQSFDQN